MSKFYCDLPWQHLSVFPHSTCSVCCEAKHTDGAPGHAINYDDSGRMTQMSVATHSVDEIINSDHYKKVRLDMINGKVPDACVGCWKTEQAGGLSKRNKDSQHKIKYEEVTSDDGTIIPDLRTIELRLGNLCNLKCRGCNAESSTRWIEDYYKLKDKVKLPSGYDSLIASDHVSYDWVDDPNFYTRLLDASPNLNNIYISGGEPFLVPKHFELLERLVSEGKTHVGIGYHTNLNYDLSRLQSSMSVLEKFDKVTLSLSIDDVGERNTYQRSLSNWDLTVKNLKILASDYPFELNVTQTFSAYNFFYCEELELFLKDNNINVKIVPNHIHAPEYMNANIFSKEARQEKLDSVRGIISESLYNNLYGRYYNAAPNRLYDEFLHFTKCVDEIRNESYWELFSHGKT